MKVPLDKRAEWAVALMAGKVSNDHRILNIHGFVEECLGVADALADMVESKADRQEYDTLMADMREGSEPTDEEQTDAKT